LSTQTRAAIVTIANADGNTSAAEHFEVPSMADKSGRREDETRKSEDELIVPKDAASTSFVKGLIARGQAARPGKDGSLPPGATHEIVGETAAGLPILRRRRFAQ
jgi:hypothetical protein